MDGVSIGDLLFIFLVSALIYGLLFLKGRGATKKKPKEGEDGGRSDD